LKWWKFPSKWWKIPSKRLFYSRRLFNAYCRLFQTKLVFARMQNG